MHRATPGITPCKFSKDPLGTEGEMTPGDDDWNPFEDDSMGEPEYRKMGISDEELGADLPSMGPPELPRF